MKKNSKNLMNNTQKLSYSEIEDKSTVVKHYKSCTVGLCRFYRISTAIATSLMNTRIDAERMSFRIQDKLVERN